MMNEKARAALQAKPFRLFDVLRHIGPLRGPLKLPPELAYWMPPLLVAEGDQPSTATKCVYGWLRNQSTSLICMNYDDLAEDIGIGTEVFRRALKQLTYRGWVRVEPCAEDPGRRHFITPWIDEKWFPEEGPERETIREGASLRLRRMSYEDWLSSAEWGVLAEAAKKAAGYRCRVCNRSRDEIILDAHHRTYERLGHELPDDLTVLCRVCHRIFHKHGRLAR